MNASSRRQPTTTTPAHTSAHLLHVKRRVPPEHPQDETQSGGGVAPSRQLVRQGEQQPVLRQGWKKQTQVQVYTDKPYETALEAVPLDPFSGTPIGSVTIRAEPTQIPDPELWKTDKFPWYFLRTKPQVAGTVIH